MTTFIRECLRTMSLDKVRNQRFIVILLVVILILSVGCTIAYSLAKFAFTPEATRDYRHLSFDIYDATMVCNEEMEARMGDTLLRSYVDQRSSRLDSGQGIYRVYIKADVGTQFDFHEVNVYCFVDKWNYDLSYYKAVDPTVKPVLTTDLKFFQ